MRLQKYLLLFFATCFCTLSFGQTNQVEFGKNRVQYHDDFDDGDDYGNDDNDFH